MSTKTITLYNDDGSETQHELPATNVVCSRCEGYGTHMNESMGSHAYTPEEFYESFDEEGQEEYFKRGGIYDVTCEECRGNKVILEVNEDACLRNSELKPIFEAWQKQEEKAAYHEAEARREQYMESRMLGEF